MARLSAIGCVSWGCWHRQRPDHLGQADLVKDAGLYILGKWQDKMLLSYSNPKILLKIRPSSIISMMLHTYCIHSLLHDSIAHGLLTEQVPFFRPQLCLSPKKK